MLSEREIMAKTASVDKRVDAMMAKCSGIIDVMDDNKKLLVSDMLHSYWWLSIQALDLETRINEEGTMIPIECGTVNNRHTEIKTNPAIKAMQQLETRKGDFYTKIMRYLTNAEKDDLDSLDDFLKA